jgi:threonine/homoserine/homoserine lactone efflux protein
MNSTELVLICFAWMLNIGSPGPATLSIAGCAMAHGRLKALWLSLGILVGGAGWGIAAAIGMGALMLANAWLFEIVRYFGALYLLYLAIKSLRSAFSTKALIVQSSKNAQAKDLFYRGLLINLSNPKAILGWGSIYALVITPSSSSWEIVYVFGTLFSCSILIFVGYALLFSNSAVVNVYQNLRRQFELSFALFFGFASFKLLTSKLST